MSSILTSLWKSSAPVAGNRIEPVPFRGIRTGDVPLTASFLISREAEPFMEFIETAIDMERRRNPDWRAWFAFFTGDQAEVRVNKFQRFRGAHADGWGQEQHNYSCAVGTPTEFFEGEFEMPEHGDHGKAVLSLERQIVYHLDLEPCRVYSFDSCAIHRSPISRKMENRTFMRLCFRKYPLEVI